MDEAVVALNELDSILLALVLSELAHLGKIEMALYFDATNGTVIHLRRIYIYIVLHHLFVEYK